MPYIGRSTDGFGVRNRFLYLASASDTSVSGADANGATLTFTDGAYVDVYLNGVLLKAGTDYNTNTANTIAGLSALNTNDEVTVIVYDVFTVGDMVSATSGGTFSGNVTFNGGAVFNENSADVDFRVESDNDANAFFVQGSDGKIGMGISTPRNNLDFGVTSNNDHVIALRDNNVSRTILGLSNGYGVRVAAPSDGTATESMLEVGEINSSDGTTYQNTHLKLTYNGDLGVGVGVTPNTFSGYQTITVGGSVATTGSGIDFEDSSGNIDGRAFGEYGGLLLVADPGNATAGSSMRFDVDGTERVRIDSAGNLIVNADSGVADVIYDDSSGNAGPILHSDHRVDVTRTASLLALNETSSSASAYVDFRKQGSTIATISDNGSGVMSYNAFTGCHWGRLSDNSKPTILKGTILETIDKMCNWYEVEFTIPEVKYVDGDAIPKDKKVGDVKIKAKDKKHLIPLADVGNKKVGDSFTFTYVNGVEYTGTLKLQNDEKHPQCKISDTTDSKKIYGVFFSWDSEDDGYNDMYVAGLGTYVIRVHKDVTVEGGDLLVSNGDGTAKVQDDDIIRTKTIGKVLTNVKQETYSDGSYTVPCALYCG